MKLSWVLAARWPVLRQALGIAHRPCAETLMHISPRGGQERVGEGEGGGGFGACDWLDAGRHLWRAIS